MRRILERKLVGVMRKTKTYWLGRILRGNDLRREKLNERSKVGMVIGIKKLKKL